MDNTFPLTFDITFEESRWAINGTRVIAATEEVATPSTLRLMFRVTSDTLVSDFRPLKKNSGKVSVLEVDDGGFISVDRAGGANTVALDPPGNRSPLRQSTEAHVQRYDEQLVSQSVGEWDVMLDFALNSNRSNSASISQTPTAEEWGIETRLGTIATSRVDADFLGRGDGGVRRFEILMRLTKSQAYSFESGLSRLNGVRVRNVPDAPNEAVDETAGDATVTINAPDSHTVVSDGDYVVTGWESRRLNDAFQEVSMTVAET